MVPKQSHGSLKVEESQAEVTVGKVGLIKCEDSTCVAGFIDGERGP